MKATSTSPLESLSELARRQVKFLSDPLVSSLFKLHPNDVAKKSDIHQHTLEGEVPEWSSWWKWASDGNEAYLDIVTNNISIHSTRNSTLDHRSLPPNIADLLRGLASISIPRFAEPVALQIDGLNLSKDTNRILPKLSNENIFMDKKPVGMSVKKIHEVSRMATYIRLLINEMKTEHGVSISHIVDIGAGKGYLSRALRDLSMGPDEQDFEGMHVLALDSVHEQTSRAELRERRNGRKMKGSSSKGSLTHRTLQLGYDLRNDRELKNVPLHDSASQMALEEVISDWFGELNQNQTKENAVDNLNDRVLTPILFVALHACGSLTPSILRSVVSFKEKSLSRGWFCAASVVVGCCYNLMERSDSLMSDASKYHTSSFPSFELSMNHLQLAAQVPLQWQRSDAAFTDFKMAVRKMLYRALLCVFIQAYNEGLSPQADSKDGRIGKLHDSAYVNFDTFLSTAGTKLNIDFSDLRRTRFPNIEESHLSRQLEVLHVLRCILGPAVESLIVVDRLCWLMEMLGDRFDVDLVNLFDQGTSSGRNLGIIILPRKNSC